MQGMCAFWQSRRVRDVCARLTTHPYVLGYCRIFQLGSSIERGSKRKKKDWRGSLMLEGERERVIKIPDYFKSVVRSSSRKILTANNHAYTRSKKKKEEEAE